MSDNFKGCNWDNPLGFGIFVGNEKYRQGYDQIDWDDKPTPTMPQSMVECERCREMFRPATADARICATCWGQIHQGGKR